MNERDFVIWINGFVTASHDYALTPKQWDTLKETLKKVVVQDFNIKQHKICNNK